jgi:hypothetical protein
VAQERPKIVLPEYEAFITYVPLRSEVPFRDFFTVPEGGVVYEIAPRAALNPHVESQKARIAVGDKKTCIFMPGRRFDASGTRFGQGGGWYDRFLSEVPQSWARVGFCFSRQFSTELLIREEWDQSMDFVCVVDEKTRTFEVHETHARI